MTIEAGTPLYLNFSLVYDGYHAELFKERLQDAPSSLSAT